MDEAIITTTSSSQSDKQKGERQQNRERELQKTSWLPKDGSSALMTLEDSSLIGDSAGKKYDQFHGKKNTYNEHDYTTKLNMDEISHEQKMRAA